VGEAMTLAIEVVVEYHVDKVAPAVIEGDGILPSLFDRPEVRQRAAAGRARAVFLVEPDEATLFANMISRGHGTAGWSAAELRTEARAKWLYGQWLAEEARRRGLPVLALRPWATLAARIVAASIA
jgi:hypothetical protein